MRRAFLVTTTLLILVAGFRFLSACLTIAPIVVDRDAAKGNGECLQCIELPASCGGIVDQCNADPRCKPAYACIVREKCFDSLTLDDKINCGLPCAADAGIQSASDPVIATYLVGLVGCAQDKCAKPCNFVDAGAAP